MWRKVLTIKNCRCNGGLRKNFFKDGEEEEGNVLNEESGFLLSQRLNRGKTKPTRDNEGSVRSYSKRVFCWSGEAAALDGALIAVGITTWDGGHAGRKEQGGKICLTVACRSAPGPHIPALES